MIRERIIDALRVVVLAGIVLLAWLVLRGMVAAQEPQLARALAHSMAIWQRPSGGVIYIHHCRTAPGGCVKRVRGLAGELERAGRTHRVDPWLLAAIAIRESGLNPSAVGRAGEQSIMQLHPRSAHGRRLATACRRAPTRCEAAAIWIAAEHLRASIDRCGSEASALGAYNSGRCVESDYARRVLARRERLRSPWSGT
jgi:hypothetical protein